MRGLILTFLFCLLIHVAVATDDSSSQATGTIGAEVFGRQARWLHGSLALSETYDDNIFNTTLDAADDFITTISPGIQFSLPGSDQPAEVVATDTTTPGGLVFGRFTDRSFRRFRAYLGYAPEFNFYKDHTEQNVVNHYAQGGAQVNLRGGLALNLVDRFVIDYDRTWAKRSTQRDRYAVNLFDLYATYPLFSKFLIRAEFANNHVEYRDDINDYRNRTDNSGSAYLFYLIGAKTSTFVQYRYVDIDYRTDNARDGDLQEALAGIVWDVTAKTRGSLQGGIGSRPYDEGVYDTGGRFVFQGNLRYAFTSRTAITLGVFHRNEESTDSFYDYTVTTGADVGFSQQLRHNLDIALDFSFRRDDYQSGDTRQVILAERTDNFFQLYPSITYAFRRGLSVSLAYAYRDRDSDSDSESFTGNSVMLKFTGSM